MEPNPLAYLLLVVLYAVFLTISIVQISRIIWHGHRWNSFQTAFLTFCAVWMSLRIVFFLATLLNYATNWFIDVVYFLPLNVEFGTFSLLALFYATTIERHADKQRWESYLRARYLFAYAALNAVLFLADAGWVFWALRYPARVQLSGTVRSYFTAGVFTALAGILVVFAVQIGRLLTRNPNVRLPFQAKTTSNVHMLVLTAALVFLFLTRCVYNYLSAAGLISITLSQQGAANTALVIFFSFFSWEILPTALVIQFTFYVPAAKRLNLDARNPYSHRAPRYGLINADAPRSPLFANPNRYESDEEGGGHTAASPAIFGGGSFFERQPFYRAYGGAGNGAPTVAAPEMQ